MPELPEVETVRAGLKQLLVGHKIVSQEHDTLKGFPNSPGDVSQFLIGAKVVDVRRRAKVLMIDLDTKYTLVIHLKMTGQLVYRGAKNFGAGHPNDSLIGKLPDRSTRVQIELDNGATLFFNDQRKFGWMRLLPTIEVPNIDFMKKVGPEPLEDDFTAEILFQRLQRRKNTCIKAAILDQTVLAGIGNIYADESLWGAKIHPSTLVKYVSKTKIQILFREIQFVLRLSIEKGGSTDRNYVNAEGKRGSYIDFARVFRKEGMPCSRHPDTLIVKIRVAGRGTHICPKCQKIKTSAP
ncbi:bifunctional DNA-formamidopyrimidine glycosylase/DNA-(apurinic or apyrimidinic site) lyase [Candidatus Nomurabacteria bacterium]|nr:bifunctional DNA-formamidopyrimidine glycosylase/DNA-(apurinic or apyrimidinic site) lyase [Candidatus Nomurabacteria bacterium]